MFLFFGNFLLWSFLLYILSRVSMSSHKWTRLCTPTLKFSFIICLIYFNAIPLFPLFYFSFIIFFFLSPFRNHRSTNKESFVHTVISVFYVTFFFFFFPPQWNRAGSVLCWISEQDTLGALKPFDFTLCHF